MTSLAPPRPRGLGGERAATIVLGCLIALAVILRFWNLGGQSLWLDELWTAAQSDPGLALGQWLEEWILGDVHPPLYIYLMRQWQQFFGAGEISLRLPSVLFSLGFIGTAALIPGWTFSPFRRWLLAGWFACTPAAVIYAQEARVYTLLLMLSAAAMLLSVAIARRIEAGQPILRPCLALSAVILVAEYSHYFGALVGFGCFAALAGFAVIRDRSRLGPILVSGSVALLLFLPWLVFHAAHITDQLSGSFWITNNWERSLSQAARLAVGLPLLCAVMAAAVALAFAARPGRLCRADGFVPVVALASMLGGALLISLHTPVITDRNLLILLPPFFLLAVTLVDRLRMALPGGLRFLAVVVGISVPVIGLGASAQRLSAELKDQWREAAAQVAGLPGCGQAILPVYRWPEEFYAYYLPPADRPHLNSVTLEQGAFGLATAWMPLVSIGSCPLLLWAGHVGGDALTGEVAQALEIPRDRIVVARTKGHMLLLDRRDLERASGS